MYLPISPASTLSSLLGHGWVRSRGEKYPALDFDVDILTEEGSAWSLGKQFAVQLKHVRRAPRNEDGSISLQLEVEHVRFWVGSQLPVLIVLFLVDEKLLLYRWACRELLTSVASHQQQLTVRFQPSEIYGSGSMSGIQTHVEEFIKRTYPEVEIPARTTDFVLANEVLVPGQPNLVFYSTEPGLWAQNFTFVRELVGESALILRSVGSEDVGLNRHVPNRRGRAQIRYQARGSGRIRNSTFYAIPIRSWNPVTGLYDEIARSRSSKVVPLDYVNDNEWHTAFVEFDFTALEDFGFTVIAPRLNEETPEKGPGELALHSISVL